MVDRAEGVWIWVYFVVRELLRDIRDNEPFEQLQKRIDSYPIELGSFFDVIMGRIDPVHMTSAARLMLSLTAAIEPLSVLALEMLEEDEDFVDSNRNLQVIERRPGGSVQPLANTASKPMPRSHKAGKDETRPRRKISHRISA